MDARLSGLQQLGVAFASAVALAGCGREQTQAGPSFASSDSAGIEIVVSSRPMWTDRDRWTVSEAPTLAIGSATGAPEYTLYGVTEVLGLQDGRIVVVNSGTRQLRFYDRDGKHILDVGGVGEGPGEFAALRQAWHAPGDSIIAFDFSLSRATILDDQGRLGRTIPLRPTAGASQVFALRPFHDGDLLVAEIVRGALPTLGLFDGGVRRYGVSSADGELLRHLVEVPIGRKWGFEYQGSSGYASAPFELSSVPSAADGSFLFVGPGTHFELQQFGRDGLVRLIRWSAAPRSVTPEIEDQYRSWQRQAFSDPEFRGYAEAKLDGMPFPERLPAYQRLLTDSEGYLWVERYRPPWDDQRSWSVIDPDGVWLGEPELPTDVDLRHVGRDHLLGVRRDAHDVEYVVRYELRR